MSFSKLTNYGCSTSQANQEHQKKTQRRLHFTFQTSPLKKKLIKNKMYIQAIFNSLYGILKKSTKIEEILKKNHRTFVELS